MVSEEILKKVKRLEILARNRIDSELGGEFKSQFKGHGIQFSEHRVYNPGDDVRHIDWKVSARSKDPVIRLFEEERELIALLVVDISGSDQFGSGEKRRKDVIAELGSLIAYGLNRSGDRVGAVFFTSKIEKMIPPKRKRNHLLQIIRALVEQEPEESGTNLSLALQSASRLLKQKGIVFVLSDFMAPNFEKELKMLAKKHEVIAFWIQDPRESHSVSKGYFLLRDSELGTERMVKVGSYAFREWLQKTHREREKKIEAVFKKSQVDYLKVSTYEDYAESTIRFFRKRQSRVRS